MGLLRGLILTLAGAVLVTGLLAEDPQPGRPSGGNEDPSKLLPAASGKPPERKSGGLTALENLKLPAGAVIVVCDDIKDALRLLPKAVVLAPEKYQELLDQVDQGKRQDKEAKPEVPSVCRLSGQVEGDFVRLRARYEFRTERPSALVALGTARAWATSAILDDNKLPVLLALDEGLALQIETPGTHQLVLELLVPVNVRGSRGLERAIDMGLPRAAITTLDSLVLPSDASDIRVGGRVARATREPGGGPTKLTSVPLGTVERLDLIWKSGTPDAQKGPPVLTARSKVVAHITENQLTTDVELNLEVVHGETAQWSILLPLPEQAILDVVKPPLQDERLRGIQMPDGKNPLLTIRLKEPSAEPLQVVLQIRQPRSSGATAIGPCTVLNAFPHRGTLDVRAPTELRVRCLPRGEVSEREIAEEQRREGTIAAFTYWSSQPVTSPSTTLAPWVTLETEAVVGAVEGKVAHLLRRSDGERESPDVWRLSSKFDLTPLRTGVDRLEVRVPVGWQLDRAVGATPADLVEEVTLDPESRVATIRLSQRQFRQFLVTLPGSFAASSGSGKFSGLVEFATELPMLAGWGLDQPAGGERKPAPVANSFPVLDRGGQVMVQVPDGMELLAGPAHGERPAPGVREVTSNSERMPRRAELLLQALHPELTVQSQVDINLQDDQARVRQRLQYHFPQVPPIQVELQVPRALAGRVRVLEGGHVPPVSEGRGAVEASALHVTLTDSAAPDGTSHVVTLEYLIPYEAERPNSGSKGRTTETTANARRVEIPLVQPDKSARGQARVRVWTDPGHQASLASSGWEEEPLEIVADHPTLPDLVLRGRLDAGLRLQLEPRASPLAGAVVERILVQATLSSSGVQTFRTRYVLKRIHARELEVLLPVPVAQAQLDVVLDGKRLTITAAGEPQASTVRVHVEPELYSQPVLLEIACQPRTPIAWEFGGTRCTIQPPALQDVLLLGRCRLLVDAPPNWILATAGWGSVVEQEWGRRGWLLGLRPTATTNELESWLLGTTVESGGNGLEPSLVCWSNAQNRVSLFVVSNQVWLLGCSLLLLAVGLVFESTALPRAISWALAGGVCAGLSLLAIATPGLLPLALYGCQPGLLVFVLILLVQWLLYRTYRRQVVFLPGFKRIKTGSSLVRTESSNRRRTGVARDPGVVDEPPRQGSSSAVELREVK